MPDPSWHQSTSSKCVLGASGTDEGTHCIPSVAAQEFKPRLNGREASLQHLHTSCSPRTHSPP